MGTHLYVEETLRVGGGYLRVRGTRIPVRIIVACYQACGDVDSVQRLFPSLTHEQIQGVLDYYAEHPTRVDEDIQRNARALAELRHRPGSGR